MECVVVSKKKSVHGDCEKQESSDEVDLNFATPTVQPKPTTTFMPNPEGKNGYGEKMCKFAVALGSF